MKELYKGTWLKFKRSRLGSIKDDEKIVIMTEEELKSKISELASRMGSKSLIEEIMKDKSKPTSTPMPYTSTPSSSDTVFSGAMGGGDKDMPIPKVPEGIKIPKAPAVFKRRINMILKDNMEHRRHGNKRSGMLDIKHLSRIHTTDRIFERAEDISKKQYNISILIDCSGSMSGKKCRIAQGASVALVRDLQEICNVEVIGFDHETRVLKPFDKLVRRDKLWDTVGKQVFARGGNHDHISVKIATKRLLKQKGQKILLVISDGQPSCGSHGDECDEHCSDGGMGEQLIKSIAEAEKRGVLVLGLGLVNDSVQYYYKKYRVIGEADKLHETVLDMLNKSIRSIAVE